MLIANNAKIRSLTGWVPATDMSDTVLSILNYWRDKVTQLYAPSRTSSGTCPCSH
jgi:hypothetical protein